MATNQRMDESQESAGPKLEAAWIAQIGRGDRAAFERFYRAYERRLYRYLFGIVGSAETADELTNDVMVEVWRGAHRYRGQSKPSTWVFGIAHHKAVDALRRRPLAPVVELHTLSSTPDPRPSPEDSALRESLRRSVAAALANLSADHRAVVELTFSHGYSYNEIAGIVGCPVNTVKTRMFHARKQLRRVFEGRGVRREIS